VFQKDLLRMAYEDLNQQQNRTDKRENVFHIIDNRFFSGRKFTATKKVFPAGIFQVDS
jgi:hypothetical protein